MPRKVLGVKGVPEKKWASATVGHVPPTRGLRDAGDGGLGDRLPAILQGVASPLELRRATVDDVEEIVRLLADDQLGVTRESTAAPDGLAPYLAAFEQIASDDGQLLLVGTAGDDVVATLQLSFIPGQRLGFVASHEGLKLQL